MKMTEHDKKAVARKKDFKKEETYAELLTRKDSTERERVEAFIREWKKCKSKGESWQGYVTKK